MRLLTSLSLCQEKLHLQAIYKKSDVKEKIEHDLIKIGGIPLLHAPFLVSGELKTLTLYGLKHSARKEKKLEDNNNGGSWGVIHLNKVFGK